MGRSGGIDRNEIGAGKDWNDLVPPLFDVFAATFLPIDQNDDKGDPALRGLDCINRFDCRSARRDDVVHNNNGVARGKISFNQFL